MSYVSVKEGEKSALVRPFMLMALFRSLLLPRRSISKRPGGFEAKPARRWKRSGDSSGERVWRWDGVGRVWRMGCGGWDVEGRMWIL